MREIRKIHPHELLSCMQLSSVCFEYPFDTDKDPEGYYQQIAAEKDTALHKSDVYPLERYAAFQDGSLTAAICALPYRIDFDGGEAAMCGIGGVCSHPAARRGGAVRDMMIEILRAERDKGTEWSVLYPFSQAFYEKFGYAQSEPSCQTRFSLRYAAKPARTGSFSLYDGSGDYAAFREAYEGMKSYNLKVRREHCDYAKLIGADPYKKNRFAYLYRDDAGVPRGYFIFEKLQSEDNLMDVLELVFDSFETLRQIVAFAAGFASDYGDIRFTAPLRPGTERLCTDQAQGEFRRSVQANGMLRAVNIEKALEKARYRGTGEAPLEILDEALGQNWQLCVRWQEGKLLDIGETSLAPLAVMPIGDFSAALIGRYEPEDFAALPSVVCENPERLRGIFYKKSSFLMNFF